METTGDHCYKPISSQPRQKAKEKPPLTEDPSLVIQSVYISINQFPCQMSHTRVSIVPIPGLQQYGLHHKSRKQQINNDKVHYSNKNTMGAHGFLISGFPPKWTFFCPVVMSSPRSWQASASSELEDLAPGRAEWQEVAGSK